MSDTRTALLRMALAALQRGDAPGGAALVTAALAMRDDEPTVHAEGARPEFASVAVFGRMVGRSGRTIRAMRAAGRLPAVCFVGSGRGLRVDVGAALAHLRGAPRIDDVEQAGGEYVTRRAALRVVGGGGGAAE